MPPSAPLSDPGGFCRPPATVPHSVQETNYYCGPACEQMLIAGMTGIRPPQWLLYCLGRQESFDPRWYTTPLGLARVLNRYRPRRCTDEFRDHPVNSAADATGILANAGGAGVAAVYRGLHFVVVNGVAPASAGGWVVITDPSRRNTAGHAGKRHRVLSPWEWQGTYMLPVSVPGPWLGRYTVIAGTPQATAPAALRASVAMEPEFNMGEGASLIRGDRLTDDSFRRVREHLRERMLKKAARMLAENGLAPSPGDLTPSDSPSPSVTVTCPGTVDGEYRLFSDTVSLDERTGYTVHIRYPNFSFTREDDGRAAFPVAEMSMRGGTRPLFGDTSPIRMGARQLLEAVRLKSHGLPPLWRAAIRRATGRNGSGKKQADAAEGPRAGTRLAAGEIPEEIRVVPEAYWEVCAESRDPMEPFRVLELGSRRLYVREDFAVFESLSPTMPVVEPEANDQR